MNIFAAITEDLEERAAREQAEQATERTSIDKIVELSDIWKFRTGYEQEALSREIKDAEAVRLQRRIEDRIERAKRFVKAYEHILTTIIEPSTKKPLFTIMDAGSSFTDVLVEAAKFDFLGMNFDHEFSVMEFVLTHENPLYIYEFIDGFVNQFIAVVVAEETALDRQRAYHEIIDGHAPEFLRLGIDAYLLHMSAEKKRLDPIKYGHDLVFDAASVETAAADTAPRETEESPKSGIIIPGDIIIIPGDENKSE